MASALDDVRGSGKNEAVSQKGNPEFCLLHLLAYIFFDKILAG